MPAMPLWIKIAMNILKVLVKVVQRPRANPSKNEWTDSATMIIKPDPLSCF